MGSIVNPGNAPCMNCQVRSMRCHSTCEKYAKYRKDYEARSEAAFGAYASYIIMEGHAKRRGRPSTPIDHKMRKGERGRDERNTI